VLCGVLSEGYQSGQAGPSGTVHNHQRADYKRAGRNYEKEKDNLRDGSLVILNNQTKEIFEYTDLTKNDLPDEVHQMLKEKKKFHSVEEVYHFLESYSS